MTKQVMMTAGDIECSLDRMAHEIIARNQNPDELAILGVHTGGAYLANRLTVRLEAQNPGLHLPAGVLDITLYRDDWTLLAQNPLVKNSHITFPLEDKRLILVDDVFFTGRTVRAALDAIMDYGRPLAIQLAVLVDRGGRELPIQPDYVGMRLNVKQDDRVDVLLRENGGADEVLITTAGARGAR